MSILCYIPFIFVVIGQMSFGETSLVVLTLYRNHHRSRGSDVDVKASILRRLVQSVLLSSRSQQWQSRRGGQGDYHLDLFLGSFLLPTSVTRKKSPNVYISCPKMISLKNDSYRHLYKNCLRMWEIWANYLLPKALKSCPKLNKLPNLVTLLPMQ